MSAYSAETPYQVQIEAFEGPLDLLLYLVRQNEIDIYDIQIAAITDQYLEYLRAMKDLNLEIAGEFLVMAATLIQMKSRMLLPQEGPEVEAEVEEFKQELVERLLEHERFRKAAALLHDRQVLEMSVWGRGPGEFEQEEKEAVSAGVFDLIGAFQKMLERFKEQILLEIEHESVSFEERLGELRRLVSLQKEFFFSTFFRQKISRLSLVVTFFALLEMTRLGEVRLVQEALFADIRVIRC